MAFPTSGDIFLLSLCFFLFWIITQFDFTLFMPINIIDSSFGASVLGWEYNLPWEEVPSCPLLQPDYTSTSLLSKLLKKFLTHTHTLTVHVLLTSECPIWKPSLAIVACILDEVEYEDIPKDPSHSVTHTFPKMSVWICAVHRIVIFGSPILANLQRPRTWRFWIFFPGFTCLFLIISFFSCFSQGCFRKTEVGASILFFFFCK